MPKGIYANYHLGLYVKNNPGLPSGRSAGDLNLMIGYCFDFNVYEMAIRIIGVGVLSRSKEIKAPGAS
jgi:hypothetical protein